MDEKKANDIEYLMSEIARTVEDATGIETTDPQARLSDRKIDSITLLEIMTVIENKFQIVLNEEMVKEFTSVARIAYIVQHALRNLESPSRRRPASPS